MVSSAAKVCAIPELLENILKNLSKTPRELFKLQRVSRTFRNVIVESSTLQHAMGLKYNSDTCLTGVRTIDNLLHPFLAAQDKFDFWPFVRDGTTTMLFERSSTPTDYASAGVGELAVRRVKNTSMLREHQDIINAVEKGFIFKDIHVWFHRVYVHRPYVLGMQLESWLHVNTTRGSWRDVYVTSLPVGIRLSVYDSLSSCAPRTIKGEHGKPVTLGCLVDALKQVSLP